MPPAEESFLSHVLPRDRVPLASKVRGTVLVSSLRGLRTRGHLDGYMAKLDRRHHEAIAAITAATWLPMELALAHYRACEELDLEPQTIEAIGAESGNLINQTVLTVVAKLSKESGVTPWFALSNANKMVQRTWVGSSLAVWKLGPKEARFEWIQQPISRFRYCRLAFAAFTSAICSHFARAIYVREIPQRTKDTEVSYRVSWV